MKATTGVSFAAVVIMFTRAAWRTPFSTMAWTSQRPMDAPITEGRLLPLPNTGKKKAKAPNTTTALETLPSQPLSQ